MCIRDRDESGNEHHGNVVGATLTTDRNGTPNNAYWFDGNNDRIIVPDHPDLRLGGGDFSISLWMYLDNFSDPVAHAFMSKRNGINQNGYAFLMTGFNHPAPAPQGIVSFLASGGTNPSISSQSQLSSKEWVHILITSDQIENKSRLYINGTLEKEESAFFLNQTTTTDLFFGMDLFTFNATCSTCNGYFFDGVLDDIRIYDRPLNLAEINILSTDIFCSNVNFTFGNTVLNNGFYSDYFSINSSSIIPPNGKVQLEAEYEIILLESFETNLNSNFHATLKPCSSSTFNSGSHVNAFNENNENTSYQENQALNKESLNIKIYPNPTKQTLFIKGDDDIVKSFLLLNLTGKMILNETFQSRINLGEISSGIYFLQLIDKNGEIIKTEKVVIINENRA